MTHSSIPHSSIPLILASASPRRRELLAQVGLQFEVIPAHIDETRHANEDPAIYVARLALEKAQAIHAQHPDAIVLGADTTVVLNGEVLNKPADLAEAEKMLRSLSGQTHQVHTGIAVVGSTAQRSHVETTNVIFAPIPEEDLAAYLATGDSLDKAGAYGIQGYAARWIPRIEGDYFNVMGLPVAATVKLLAM
jgi:septum formation protein